MGFDGCGWLYIFPGGGGDLVWMMRGKEGGVYRVREGSGDGDGDGDGGWRDAVL